MARSLKPIRTRPDLIPSIVPLSFSLSTHPDSHISTTELPIAQLDVPEPPTVMPMAVYKQSTISVPVVVVTSLAKHEAKLPESYGPSAAAQSRMSDVSVVLSVTPLRSVQAVGSDVRQESSSALVTQPTIVDALDNVSPVVTKHEATSPVA